MQARSIYYTFDQRDLLHGVAREGNESWMEWTRSWGAKLRRASFELHYRGRTTTGAGRPGVDPVFGIPVASVRSDVLPPVPTTTATTTLRDVSVVTHQLSISLFIR